MKKIATLLLALVMILSLPTAVIAAESSDVTATYNPGSDAAIVYEVDITWEGLEFTYNGAVEGQWDATKHEYVNSVEAGWAEGEGTITITNHSNTGITATPSYTAEEGYEGVSMVFSTTALQIATADNGVNGAAGTAVTGTITVTPAGVLPESANETVIGVITIEIN